MQCPVFPSAHLQLDTALADLVSTSICRGTYPPGSGATDNTQQIRTLQCLSVVTYDLGMCSWNTELAYSRNFMQAKVSSLPFHYAVFLAL